MSKAAVAKKHIVGVDVGYSNVKVVGGSNPDALNSFVFPAQAAPLDKVEGGLAANKDATLVEIQGEQWLAFYKPGNGELRELNPDYPASQAYLALFYAGLIAACPEGNVIDCLVTGLPVHHYFDPQKVDALEKRLTGVHQVTAKTKIEVKQVKIVAQPVGTMLDVYSRHEDADLFPESTVLVVDPGFFSLDWVLFKNGILNKQSSGTSLKAMSIMIEAIYDGIRADYGVSPRQANIEIALQSGKTQLAFRGTRLDITPYIDKAKLTVAQAALADLRTEMRFMENESLDFVLMGGGGASFYQDEVNRLYPDSKIIVSEKSVSTNAYGFWVHGASE